MSIPLIGGYSGDGSGVAYFECSRHGIVSADVLASVPHPDSERAHCPECHMGVFFVMLSKIPEDRRDEFVETLEATLYRACELEDSGRFPFMGTDVKTQVVDHDHPNTFAETLRERKL